MAEVYIALLHHPVYDKNHRVVTTAVTNIDVHDIARSARTYGAKGFYVITPVDALRGLVRKIIRHWREGIGATYNANRKDALGLVRLTRSLEQAEADIEAATGRMPLLVATTARRVPDSESFAQVRSRLETGERPYLLLLGTGWGLTDEILDRCDLCLPPVLGPGAYNHLSVRAAAAVILDRLLGTR